MIEKIKKSGSFKKIKTYEEAKKVLYSIGGINEKEANTMIKNMYKND